MPAGQSGIVRTQRKLGSQYKKGFTLSELLIVIVIIAALALIAVVTYQGMQRRSNVGVVSQTVSDALKSLQIYYAFNRSFPANLADTDYVPPLTVATTLYTNVPQLPYYESLTANQNAQLFLNACNGFMPIMDGSTQYNTACVYSGNNAHIKGTVTSNVIINGPSIDESDFELSCGSVCDAARQRIVDIFKQQGGSFPITVPKEGSTLPKPASYSVNGAATRFCVEAQSAWFTDVVVHATSERQILSDGPCPDDPELHYP